MNKRPKLRGDDGDFTCFIYTINDVNLEFVVDKLVIEFINYSKQPANIGNFCKISSLMNDKIRESNPEYKQKGKFEFLKNNLKKQTNNFFVL